MFAVPFRTYSCPRGQPTRRHRPARPARAAQRHRALVQRHDGSRASYGRRARSARPPYTRCLASSSGRTTFFFRHGFSSCAQHLADRFAPHVGHNPRRFVSSVVTGRPPRIPPGGHRPSPQSRPLRCRGAAASAVVVGQRRRTPHSSTASRRVGPRAGTSRWLGDSPATTAREQLQHRSASTSRVTARPSRVDARNCDPWHSSRGPEARTSDDFIHSVRSQLPIRGNIQITAPQSTLVL